MFSLFKKAKTWPETPFEEIKKRARLLVIDDDIFPYGELFKRDGYAIEQWRDVDDLNKLETGAFDLILLDVQGVGKAISASEQGLGVLHHIRKVAPAQVVIAFSSADFSLKYQDFFRLADATLSKSADYVDFKRKVDELLRERFSLGFYVNRIIQAADAPPADRAKLEKEAQEAIMTNKHASLKTYLWDKVTNKDNIEVVIKIAKIATEVADKWQK